jgi:hypothetical protein
VYLGSNPSLAAMNGINFSFITLVDCAFPKKFFGLHRSPLHFHSNHKCDSIPVKNAFLRADFCFEREEVGARAFVGENGSVPHTLPYLYFHRK